MAKTKKVQIHYHIINKKKEAENSKATSYDAYGFASTYDYLDSDRYPRIDLDKRNLTTEEEIIESKEVNALVVTSARKKTYYVKKNSNGKLFNPLDMFDELKGKRTKRESRPTWTMTRVEERVFQHYLNFLATRNTLHLQKAEREV